MFTFYNPFDDAHTAHLIVHMNHSFMGSSSFLILNITQFFFSINFHIKYQRICRTFELTEYEQFH